MITPASAPSTPASNEPAVVTGLPFSYSVVVLAQVPDVAVGVLRVPVVGHLHELAVLGHHVVHHAASTPAATVFVRGVTVTTTRWTVPSRVRLAIDPAAAGRQREVGVVDPRREVGGVELHVLGAAGKRRRPVAGTASSSLQPASAMAQQRGSEAS